MLNHQSHNTMESLLCQLVHIGTWITTLQENRKFPYLSQVKNLIRLRQMVNLILDFKMVILQYGSPSMVRDIIKESQLPNTDQVGTLEGPVTNLLRPRFMDSKSIASIYFPNPDRVVKEKEFNGLFIGTISLEEGIKKIPEEIEMLRPWVQLLLKINTRLPALREKEPSVLSKFITLRDLQDDPMDSNGLTENLEARYQEEKKSEKLGQKKRPRSSPTGSDQQPVRASKKKKVQTPKRIKESTPDMNRGQFRELFSSLERLSEDNRALQDQMYHMENMIKGLTKTQDVSLELIKFRSGWAGPKSPPPPPDGPAYGYYTR